ncbi:CU044_2847 family protein [Nodosilinea sp. FACHB-141]|uniref:Trypsin-co-occurring domain-containing protein n=1 Tax=Leptolyngbya subtilissima DQ-A4 TaxID=2933933 RepID=A0ABV0KBK0_9CYAN|nr:CU044_2847 family protein [Nodosilinea sp. FACHB-141]MBD2115099.1 hypothetical protein [Nodosilinea sp. FACHB-141]
MALTLDDKMTLECGVKVAGEARVPYLTKGTADANLKITVECSFLRKAEASALEGSSCQTV